LQIIRGRHTRRSLLRGTGLAVTGLIGLGLLATPDGAHADDGDDGIPLAIPDDIGPKEHWVDVNLTHQAAVAMVGTDWTHVALVTTGKPGWETPVGQFFIVRRVYNETMTSASLGIDDPNDYYVLTDVLYTQYFTWQGHALHLNYWRPDYVFGREATSHGCVGMRMDDAAYFWNHVGVGSRVVVHP
jgi:lipoprotein-anchoring transpeptidase ErfK/SrfK